MKFPYQKAMDQLRGELLPINYIELSQDTLILGGTPTCTSLKLPELNSLIKALLDIRLELHERQMP